MLDQPFAAGPPTLPAMHMERKKRWWAAQCTPVCLAFLLNSRPTSRMGRPHSAVDVL